MNDLEEVQTYPERQIVKCQFGLVQIMYQKILHSFLLKNIRSLESKFAVSIFLVKKYMGSLDFYEL